MRGHISKKRAFAFLLSLLLTVQMTLPAGCLEAIAQSVVGRDAVSELTLAQDDAALDVQATGDVPATPEEQAADKDGAPEVEADSLSEEDGEPGAEVPQDGLVPMDEPEVREPLKIEARAADYTQGGLTVSGGTNGTDYTFSSDNLLVINTDTPLTLKGTFTGSVQIAQGQSANLTLNGVTITANNTSSPINLMGSGTTLRLSVADNTTNTFQCAYAAAGIHCGKGSTLYIDDAVANWSGTTHVEVLNGVVDTAATLDNGTSVSKGDPVTRLASSNPGLLVVKGGPDASGIGSGPNETAGYMYFDGGDITSYAWGGHGNNSGYSSGNASSGSGIGGGAKGGGTSMWFNGARIHSYGSYHGAGVGGGWSSSNGSGNQTGFTAAGDNLCSNIYINAGYLYSEGYDHGNGFGAGCGTYPTNRIVRVTGGTLHPVSKGSTKDIGGRNGYTIVTGGSAYVSAKNKFEGLGDTAYNTQGVTTWADVTALGDKLPDTDKVFMLTVDLSSSDEKLNNEKLESFKLYIGGEQVNYGAPTEFEGGKLYLWLPEWVAKPNAEKEVRIEMSVRRANGDVVTIDPLYIAKPSSSDTTQTVKRYIEFPFPDDYQATLEKDYDGLPFSALTVDAAHPITVTRQVGSETVTELLNKGDDVKFKYQMLKQDAEGNWVPDGIESEEGLATLPTDTGRFSVTMTSYQYAKDPKYSASYWGHQAKGIATIKPVPAVLTMDASPEWGHLDDSGTWTPITQENADVGVAGNRLKLQFNIRSANTTATTCAAPTGAFQVSIDGQPAGDPIPLTSEAVKGSAHSAITWPDVEVANDKGVMQTRHATQVVYYFDPTNNDALLKALEDASKGGTHTVNIEYVADKNYIQGKDKNPENVKEDDTFIVPVPPTTDVKPDPKDSDVDIDDVDPDKPDPDKPDPDDPDDKGVKVVHKKVTLRYSDYKDKNLGLTFESTSSMPMECSTANTAVAELVQNDDGSVLDASGKVNLKVNSCGTTRIVMEQPANALYTGTKVILDVEVIPDESIKPQVQIRLVTNNLTHPGEPARPGDEIEYLVTGLNLVKGSAWQTAKLLDTMDPRLELVEDSVSITNNYATPDVSTWLGTEQFYAEALKQGFNWSSFDWDALAATEGNQEGQYTFDEDAFKVTSLVGTVYGGQSVTMRFKARLASGTADRPKNEGDPKDIEPGPGGDGTYGVKTNPAPGETPKNPTRLDPEDPTDPGVIPPLPIIPKDPVVDPDPDDPDAKPDIVVDKAAENLTHPEAKHAMVGDVIAYTITLTNKGKDTAWYSPVIRDTLPQGLEFVPGTLTLTGVDGTKTNVADSAYVDQTRTIALYVDDLYGGESVSLTFQCQVTPDAQGTEGTNVAYAFGQTPTDKWKEDNPDPDPDDPDDPGKDPGTDPDPGKDPGTDPDDPGKDPKPKPKPGDPFVPDPPKGTDPDDPDYDPWDDFDWDDYPSDTPTPKPSDPTPTGSEPGIIPADPKDEGLAMALTGENLTRDISHTMVGDTIRYTATFTNTQDHTQLYDTVLRNLVPEGLQVIPGSIHVEVPNIATPSTLRLRLASPLSSVQTFSAAFEPASQALRQASVPQEGEPVVIDEADAENPADSQDATIVVPVADEAYDAQSRTIGVHSGHMPAGTSVQLVYDAVVGPKAAGKTIVDHAWGHGYKPSAYDVDGEQPTIGKSFVPEGGLELFLASEGLATLPARHEIPVSEIVDPADGEVVLTKTAQNLTTTSGETYVGDKVLYTLTLANRTAGSMVFDAVFEDTLPAGVTLDESTVSLTTAQGRQVSCSGVYDASSRRLAVVAGEIAGGAQAQLTFQVTVNESAPGTDVGNVARAFGTKPSQLPDGPYTPLTPGSPYVPSQGWDAFLALEDGRLSVTSGDPVYPSPQAGVANHTKTVVLPARTSRVMPKTGDVATLAPLLSLLGAASVALTAAVRRKRS